MTSSECCVVALLLSSGGENSCSAAEDEPRQASRVDFNASWAASTAPNIDSQSVSIRSDFEPVTVPVGAVSAVEGVKIELQLKNDTGTELLTWSVRL